MGASFTITKGGPGKGAAKLKELGGRIRAALPSALESLGPRFLEAAKAEMRHATPLHPYTVMRKGSAVPLLGGALEAALTCRVESTSKGAFVWFGVPSSAGQDLLRVARVQEFGCTINVTPAMRGYLAATGLHLAAETAAVIIPPRPFVSTALERVRAGREPKRAIEDALSAAVKR